PTKRGRRAAAKPQPVAEQPQLVAETAPIVKRGHRVAGPKSATAHVAPEAEPVAPQQVAPEAISSRKRTIRKTPVAEQPASNGADLPRVTTTDVVTQPTSSAAPRGTRSRRSTAESANGTSAVATSPAATGSMPAVADPSPSIAE